MILDSLKKIYYTNPNEHQKIYTERFNAPYTRHFDINIKEINREVSHPLFFYYTDETISLMESIFIANSKLEVYLRTLPKDIVDQYMRYSIILEILATNRIEGVFSTRKEISETMRHQLNDASPKRFLSVINKYRSIEAREQISFDKSEDIRTFYNEFLLDEIINADPGNTPDGEIFRKKGVVVGDPKAIHEGLLPESTIITTMNKALNIINDNRTPALINIAIFHYLFGYIHPFYDGNGRTSRFITSYYIARILSPLAGLRLSITIKKRRSRYYKMFKDTTSVNNFGDITPFVINFLEFIYESITDIEQYLKKKMDSFNKFKSSLHQVLQELNITDELTIKIYDILLRSVLFNNEGCTIDDIVKETKKSRNTIDDRLKKIPLHHIIKDTSTKQYTYRLNSALLKNKDILE